MNRPEVMSKVQEGRARAFRGMESGLALRVRRLLRGAGVYDGFRPEAVLLGSMLVDEFCAARGLVVEVNGCYWHGCRCSKRAWTVRQMNRAAHDEYKYARLRNAGWTVLVVRECQVVDDVKAVVDWLTHNP